MRVDIPHKNKYPGTQLKMTIFWQYLHTVKINVISEAIEIVILYYYSTVLLYD